MINLIVLKRILLFSSILGCLFFYASLKSDAFAQTCGQSPYNNKTTYCTVSAIGREIVPNFSGCRTGEFCVSGVDIGNPGCDWTYVESIQGLGLCYGGFSTEEQLRQTTVEFQCTAMCQGIFTERASGVIQTFDSRNAVVGQANGKYYSCVGGQFDQSFINAVRYHVDSQGLGCTIVDIGSTFLIPTPGGVVALPVKVAKLVANIGSATSRQCDGILGFLGQFKPTIQARVMQQNGQPWCTRDITLSVNAEEVVKTEGGVGAPPPGTSVNQGGDGLFCPGMAFGLNTAIGCVPFNSKEELIGYLLARAVTIGGGISFLIILAGAFNFMTSKGDPKKVALGQQLVTAGISGILFLIFAVLVYRTIGSTILGIL